MIPCCRFRQKNAAPVSYVFRGGIEMFCQQKVTDSQRAALLFFGELAHPDIVKPDGTCCVKHAETEK